MDDCDIDCSDCCNNCELSPCNCLEDCTKGIQDCCTNCGDGICSCLKASTDGIQECCSYCGHGICDCLTNCVVGTQNCAGSVRDYCCNTTTEGHNNSYIYLVYCSGDWLPCFNRHRNNKASNTASNVNHFSSRQATASKSSDNNNAVEMSGLGAPSSQEPMQRDGGRNNQMTLT